MTAKLGDHRITHSDLHIVDAGASAARNLACGRNQEIAELARPDEGDVALRRDDTLVVAVACEGKGGIGKAKDEATMGDPLTVDHVGRDRHRQRRLARLDLDDLHAEALAGVVVLPHRIRASACQILGRYRMPSSACTKTMPCSNGEG